MPCDYRHLFHQAIDKIKTEGRYRIFTDLSYLPGRSPNAWSNRLQKNITVWCSNDYLGMSRHPIVVEAMQEAAARFGAGAGGTRNISGTHYLIVELEREMASLHSKESGLVFTSGYVSNQATISALTKALPDLVIFSDSLNHASIIAGIKESGAIKHVFPHSDVEALEKLLQQYPLTQPKLIIFESVYSMTGNIAPIANYINLAKKYNALTYIDEVHSVGLYGNEGSGVSEMLGLAQDIDIIQGTFAKAYGVIGGYITGDAVIIDTVRSYAPSFIFTTALPPAVAAAALASVRYLRSSEKERLAHRAIYNQVKQRLRNLQINFIDHNTHIIPVLIGDARLAEHISFSMLQEGIYIQHINFPTVPRGTERLRITPTPLHNEEMIENMTMKLNSALQIMLQNVVGF